MKVIVSFDDIPNLEIPSFKIDGKEFSYARVVRNGTQFKFEFTKLEVCSFANPEQNYVISDDEIQAALNPMIQ